MGKEGLKYCTERRCGYRLQYRAAVLMFSYIGLAIFAHAAHALGSHRSAIAS